MHFDAAIFDMDGVITDTAAVHCSAWKETFDGFLRLREEPFREFTRNDYLAFVDGRPRYKGVELFLQSRFISLPAGSPTDGPEAPTICGIGNRKNLLLNMVLERDGVEVFNSTIDLIEHMRRKPIKVALATSSRNCTPILERAGIASLFDVRIDGAMSAEMGLSGKPEPDVFLKACADLGAEPARTVVVEDAISGVQAGARGGFGLVLGIAREDNAAELARNGADLVVSDLSRISLEDIDRWFANRHTVVRRVS
jgi:beta-phosphoglucomutase family hydrolase